MPAAKTESVIISPQAGPQTKFLACGADIVIYGGAAGGGKSWALLLDALVYAALKPTPKFNAVIFRRTSPQITAPGGLWDESFKLYPFAQGAPKQGRLSWVWEEHQTRIEMRHMQHEKDREAWQGAQVPWIGFDELTHFTESQFFYMLSRNRSMCGVKPRIRATTNPDPDSWVKVFLAPWVDDEYPDPAASGEVRYFIRENGNLTWYRSIRDVPRDQREDARSVTFIAANLYDNRKLLEINPQYEANLKAMPLIDRERLLNGNWKIRAAGNLFKHEWFDIIDQAPAEVTAMMRFWDLAGTEKTKKNNPDWTAGVKMARWRGKYYVFDLRHLRATPGSVEKVVKQTAQMDGYDCAVRMEQEPGSSGKKVIEDYHKTLDAFDFRGVPSTGDKVLRAKPASAAAEAGNIILIKGDWNRAFLNEVCAFPDSSIKDDIVDGFTGCYNGLSRVSDHVPIAVSGASADDDQRYADDDDDDKEDERTDRERDGDAQIAVATERSATRARAFDNFLQKLGARASE